MPMIKFPYTPGGIRMAQRVSRMTGLPLQMPRPMGGGSGRPMSQGRPMPSGQPMARPRAMNAPAPRPMPMGGGVPMRPRPMAPRPMPVRRPS